MPADLEGTTKTFLWTLRIPRTATQAAAVKGHLVQKRHRMKNLGNVCCRLKKKSCCDRVGPSCPTWLPQSEDARRLSEEHISDLQVEIDRPKTKQQDKRQELERKLSA
ncbi:uncharacterized protein AB9X84_007504 isoform 8-T19 [Acanthopagrus schlegelii]